MCFSGQSDLLTADEIEQLRTHLQTDTLWTELKQLMKTNGWVSDSKLVPLLEKPFMRLCARYLYLEKRRERKGGTNKENGALINLNNEDRGNTLTEYIKSLRISHIYYMFIFIL